MFTQSARQARIQRGFYRIASVLGQSLSRAATLEAVAQAAAEALGGSSAAVLVPSSGRLEAVGAYELPADLREILGERAWGDQSPLFRAAAEGRILVSSSISDDERLLPDLRGAAAANRYLSLISVPVDAPRDAGRRPRRSSSSPRSARSATTISSSRATWPTRRAARSSEASCSRPSAAPVRSRSS